MKTKRGRPPGTTKDDTKRGVVRFRCGENEKTIWRLRATREGKTLSAWIIDRLNK